MNPKLKAILEEARKRLWKLADETPGVPEADRNMASTLGDMIEDIVHCGFTCVGIDDEYLVVSPSPSPAAK